MCFKKIAKICSVIGGIFLLVGCSWIDNAAEKFDRSNDYKNVPKNVSSLKVPKDLLGTSNEDYYPVPEIVNPRSESQAKEVSLVPPGMKMQKINT